MKSKNYLRWKRQPAITGLASIGACEQGWDLHDGVTEYATVSPKGGGWRSPQNGWFWVAYGELPYKNTCSKPVETPEQAKADAMAYVKAHRLTLAEIAKRQ